MTKEKHNNIEVKRILACRLYVNQLFNQKQVAEKCVVTEKTIGKWVVKYGWKDQRNKVMESMFVNLKNMPVTHENLLFDLISYFEETAPTIAKKAIPIIKKYLEQLSAL